MTLTNAERQARYKARMKQAQLVRIDVFTSRGALDRLNLLCKRWGATQQAVLDRLLLEAIGAEATDPASASQAWPLSMRVTWRQEEKKTPAVRPETPGTRVTRRQAAKARSASPTTPPASPTIAPPAPIVLECFDPDRPY